MAYRARQRGSEVMNRWPRITGIFGLAALFTPGLVAAASADVVNLYNFGVTLSGNTVFTDHFSQGTANRGQGPRAAGRAAIFRRHDGTLPGDRHASGDRNATHEQGDAR